MSTTLAIESFSDVNIRERTNLTVAASAGDTTITVESTAQYSVGDIIYIGYASREGCEGGLIATVDSATGITLASALELDHARFEPMMSVLGDKIRIYRAANVDGTVPASESFAVLATRDIDPDQLSTYYTDSSGSSSYWYRYTYYTPLTGDETDIEDSVAVRGDDFGHYASLTEIRAEAGFSNNYNLKDSFVDQQRRAAESELNTSLSNVYTTPFDPVPEQIHILTIQLAAGLLMQAEYGSSSNKGKDLLKSARDQIKNLQSSSSGLTDPDGNDLASSHLSFYPDESAPRAFVMGDKF